MNSSIFKVSNFYTGILNPSIIGMINYFKTVNAHSAR